MGQGGSAERYTNVNPLTDQAWSNAQGVYDNMFGAAGDSLNNFNQMLGNVPSVTSMMVSPEQFGQFDMSRLSGAENALEGAVDKAGQQLSAQNLIGQLGQLAPFLQNLAGPGSNFTGNALAQAERTADQGVRNVMQQFSAGGGARSGAAMGAAVNARLDPMYRAKQHIFDTENSNFMNLLGQGMGIMGQGNQAMANLGLTGAQGLMTGAGMGLDTQKAALRNMMQTALANQSTDIQGQMANQQSHLGQLDMLGRMYGQQVGAGTQSLGLMGQLGQRETVYQPTWWERVGSDLVGGLGSIAGTVLGGVVGGPFGAAIGSQAGNLFGGGGGGYEGRTPFNTGTMWGTGDPNNNYWGLNPNHSSVTPTNYGGYDVDPGVFDWN